MKMLISLYLFVLLFGYYICFYRNNKVHKERMRVVSWVFEEGIPNGEWIKRLDIFHSVDYYEMVFKFWIPVSEFYESIK